MFHTGCILGDGDHNGASVCDILHKQGQIYVAVCMVGLFGGYQMIGTLL
jgi:hypothetical protein